MEILLLFLERQQSWPAFFTTGIDSPDLLAIVAILGYIYVCCSEYVTQLSICRFIFINIRLLVATNQTVRSNVGNNQEQ